MDRLAYTSLTGLSETAYPQRQLNNEIANLNTPGFKRSYSIVAKTLKVEGAGLDRREDRGVIRQSHANGREIARTVCDRRLRANAPRQAAREAPDREDSRG